MATWHTILDLVPAKISRSSPRDIHSSSHYTLQSSHVKTYLLGFLFIFKKIFFYLLVLCLWVSRCQGSVFLECLSLCCLPGKLPFAYKMQPWHFLPCQTPCRADWFLFMSQLGFVRFLLRPISPPIGIFYSLHFPSRTLAPQGQIHACSVLHA